MIKVVCGLIYKEDKILICRRNSSKELGGFWEFPGGKIESNETEEDALIRELKEELDMNVIIDKFYHSVVHRYEGFTIELRAYKCKFISAEFQLIDHDKYEWMSPSDITMKKLAPADIPIIEKLINDEKHFRLCN